MSLGLVEVVVVLGLFVAALWLVIRKFGGK
jgi:hypothetical protein